MLFIIRFLKGYAVIVFSGENTEKMLNACVASGIKIWGMVYKKGYITAKTDISSFKRMHKIKRSIRGRVKIVSKHGLPFWVKRYKNRLGIVTGIAIFIALTQFLSTFIWNISVKGNEKISTSEIIRECKEIGIEKGVKSKKINSKIDAQKLILKDGRIAWASFNTEGCNLTVNISESTALKGDKNMPSNLKAKCDGIIKNIKATSGNVTVKRGDVVAKGDVLVSGVTEHLYSTHFKRSIGEISAETVREFTEEIDLKSKETIPFGNKKTKYTVSILGTDIPLYFGKIGNVKIYSEKSSNLTFLGANLPITVYKIKYRNITEKEITRNEETAKEILRKRIKKSIKNINPISSNLTSETVIQTENGIILKQLYTMEEIISYEEKINIGTAN